MMKIVYFLTLITLTACSIKKPVDPFDQIENGVIRSILKKSIEFHGGMDRWKNIRKITYSKNFDLLLKDGSVEQSFHQEHSYDYGLSDFKITSQQNGRLVISVKTSQNFYRTVNGEPIRTNSAQLARTINSATYVLGMPFKLLDPGVSIQYLGVDTIPNGQEAMVLSASYDTEVHANHSSDEPWRYYFDPETGKVLGNWVLSSDHANFIENISYEEVGGLLLHQYRKSYRLDSLGNIDYLRAEYRYGDYEINE